MKNWLKFAGGSQGAWNPLSFEALLILFLFSGYYKSLPVFDRLDINLLYYVGPLCLLTGLVALFRSGPPRKFDVLLLLSFTILIIWCEASRLWAPASEYAHIKSLKVIAFVVPAFVGTFFVVASSACRIDRFFNLLLAFALFIVVAVAYDMAFGSASWFRVGKMFDETGKSVDYIAINLLLGYGCLILLSRVLSGRYKLSHILGVTVTIGGLFGTMLVTGGKGPLLALLLSSLILLLGTTPTHKTVSVGKVFAGWALVTGLILAVILAIERNLESATIVRSNFFIEQLQFEDYTRIAYLKLGWTFFWERPLAGYGLGSWPTLVGSYGQRDYPHNLTVELLVECGLIGALLFHSCLVRAGWIWLRSPRGVRVFTSSIAICLFYSTLCAHLSSDLPDNRFLFIFLGMLNMARAKTPLLESSRTRLFSFVNPAHLGIWRKSKREVAHARREPNGSAFESCSCCTWSWDFSGARD